MRTQGALSKLEPVAGGEVEGAASAFACDVGEPKMAATLLTKPFHRTSVSKLARLVEYLDSLRARATVEDLRRRMENLDIALEDVRDYVRFGEVNYLRNLVCDGPWYHMLVICWRSGQRSPIHNHAQSTCGLKVLAGVATETKFEVSPCGLVKAVASNDMHTNELVVSKDADIHQVSNLQGEGEDLVTLHIYSPPLLRMDTFSLTEKTIGEYRPMVLQDCGSGI